MAIAGVDIGTTGCKCTVYSIKGKILDEAYSEYNTNSDMIGREIDPIMVWESTKQVIKKATRNVCDLTALSVASFGEATVLLDENDHPTMNTILYTDSRGQEECDKLVDLIGKNKITAITGLTPHNNFSISKLMWIKENLPKIFNQTKNIFLYSDFITYMLTGERKIDYSLASRTMAFDLKERNWSKEIFEKAGIKKEMMSEPVPTGTKCGYLKKELKEEFGLWQDVLILTGCHDQIAVAIGAGVLDKGMAVDGAGTVECITPVYDEGIELAALAKGNYAKVPYVVPGHYVTYAYSFTGGALLKWYRDEIAYLEGQMAREKEKNPYDVFNSQMTEGPSQLLVLPHFAGAATPYMDSGAKGAIIGLTLETKSIDIYKALMEAVAFEMKVNIDLLKKAGIKIEGLRATGGGALSSQWLQIKADILNIPITSLGAAQSGTLGSVIIAGVSSGVYKSFEEARDIFVEVKEVYYPRQTQNAIYLEKYKKYKNMYSAIKAIL